MDENRLESLKKLVGKLEAESTLKDRSISQMVDQYKQIITQVKDLDTKFRGLVVQNDNKQKRQKRDKQKQLKKTVLTRTQSGANFTT